MGRVTLGGTIHSCGDFLAIHNVGANKGMRLYIEKVANAAGEKMKLELELFTERQIQNGIKEIRQVIRGVKSYSTFSFFDNGMGYFWATKTR